MSNEKIYFKSFVILSPYQKAIKKRLGKYIPEEVKGRFWKIPFIDKLSIFDMRQKSINISFWGKNSLLTDSYAQWLWKAILDQIANQDKSITIVTPLGRTNIDVGKEKAIIENELKNLRGELMNKFIIGSSNLNNYYMELNQIIASPTSDDNLYMSIAKYCNNKNILPNINNHSIHGLVRKYIELLNLELDNLRKDLFTTDTFSENDHEVRIQVEEDIKSRLMKREKSPQELVNDLTNRLNSASSRIGIGLINKMLFDAIASETQNLQFRQTGPLFTIDRIVVNMAINVLYTYENPIKILNSVGKYDHQRMLIQRLISAVRSSVSKISLEELFQERSKLNENLATQLDEFEKVYGLKISGLSIEEIFLEEPRLQRMLEFRRREQLSGETELQKVRSLNASMIVATNAEKVHDINQTKIASEGDIYAAHKYKERRINELKANRLELQKMKVNQEAEILKLKNEAEAKAKSLEYIAAEIDEAVLKQQVLELIPVFFDKMMKGSDKIVIPPSGDNSIGDFILGIPLFDALNKMFNENKFV